MRLLHAIAYLEEFIKINNEKAALVTTKAAVRMKIRIGVHIATDMLADLRAGETIERASHKAMQTYRTPIGQDVAKALGDIIGADYG